MLSSKHYLTMPIGPKGQKRPADVVSNAVRVMQIATGQTVDETPAVNDRRNQAAVELGRLGGKARAKNLSGKRLKAIAGKAAAARWKNHK